MGVEDGLIDPQRTVQIGIRGHMDIRIESGGAHFYTLDYTLPADT